MDEQKREAAKLTADMLRRAADNIEQLDRIHAQRDDLWYLSILPQIAEVSDACEGITKEFVMHGIATGHLDPPQAAQASHKARSTIHHWMKRKQQVA